MTPRLTRKEIVALCRAANVYQIDGCGDGTGDEDFSSLEDFIKALKSGRHKLIKCREALEKKGPKG